VTTLKQRLEALGVDVYPAIEQLSVPVFVLDANETLVYANAAARERFGDVLGRRFGKYIAPDSLARARDAYARNILATETATKADVHLVDRDGNAFPAEISAVSLENEGRVVGVFGLVDIREPDGPVQLPANLRLTPRQAEVLRLLSAGYTTAQMAAQMGISVQTVRNHVRDLLRQLRVHSRLEAVVRAQELQLAPPSHLI